MLIEADSSCLLVVDIQARLAPAMTGLPALIDNTVVLLKAANRLGVPVLASEQYSRGLGHTVPEVAELLPADSVVGKIHFSCVRDANYARRFRALDRRQAVVAGIEAHVCVLHTAEHLLKESRDVFVVSDATSSRSASNHRAALDRLRDAGARIVTTEMVVFEWLAKAGTPEFKDISALIK